MLSLTSTVDKGTRVILAVAFYWLFSSKFFNLDDSLFTLHFICIMAVAISLPFLESFASYIIYLLLFYLINDSLLIIPNQTFNINNIAYEINGLWLSTLFVVAGFMPVLFVGIVKRHRFTENFHTDSLVSTIIMFFAYIIFVAGMYGGVASDYQQFALIIKYVFIGNILIYIFAISVISIICPMLWEKIEIKRKKVRTINKNYRF